MEAIGREKVRSPQHCYKCGTEFREVENRRLYCSTCDELAPLFPKSAMEEPKTPKMKSTKVVILEMAVGRHWLKLPEPIRIKHPEEKLLLLVVGKDEKVHQKIAVDLESVIKAEGK